MARAKSPAQLQREINEALRQRAMSLDPAQIGREITAGFARQHALEEALTPGQRAYVDALVEDVRLLPDAYKASARADPRAWAVKLADGLDDADARRMARELRAETKSTLRTLGRSSHATKKPGRSASKRSHATKKSGPQTELTHRGWRITPFEGTEMGYQLPESRKLRAQLGFGTHRKFKGYEVHYPDRDGVKIVKTIKAAREYIDDYLGPEAP